MNLTGSALGNQPLLFMTVLAFVLFGLSASQNFPSQEDPPIMVREAVITTICPGMDPVKVERIVSREIRIFLENVDFGGEIAKILTSVSFEIKTEIRFIPNDQAVKPQIKNKVDAKRVKDGSKINLDDELSESADGDDDEERQSTPASSRDDAADGDEDSDANGGPRKLRWGRRRKKNGDESAD